MALVLKQRKDTHKIVLASLRFAGQSSQSTAWPGDHTDHRELLNIFTAKSLFSIVVNRTIMSASATNNNES